MSKTVPPVDRGTSHPPLILVKDFCETRLLAELSVGMPRPWFLFVVGGAHD